jgi:hypothetical protein
MTEYIFKGVKMPFALITLIPTLISLAEKVFPKSSAPDAPSTGPQKKALVTDLLLANIDVLCQHQVIPGWVGGPQADAAISEVIEWAVSNWKAKQG